MHRRRTAPYGFVKQYAVVGLLLSLFGFALGQGEWKMRVCADPDRLPFSSRDGTGFDNRIAEILAEELNADLVYVWKPVEQLQRIRDEYLWKGACDLIFGLPDGEEGFLTTIAYYRSPYAFVYLDESPFDIQSFDTPVLGKLRIGILGAPAEAALNKRGLQENVTLWDVYTQYGESDRLGNIVDAVVDGEVDVGIVWGPIAGYFAQQQPVPLKVVPVTPEVEPPFIFLVRSITVGLRPGDEAYRDRLDVAITQRWDDIRMVLEEYGVPLSPLSSPTVSESRR